MARRRRYARRDMQSNLASLPTDVTSLLFVIGLPVLLLLLAGCIGLVVFKVLGGKRADLHGGHPQT